MRTKKYILVRMTKTSDCNSSFEPLFDIQVTRRFVKHVAAKVNKSRSFGNRIGIDFVLKKNILECTLQRLLATLKV